jgi:hypothetical protein
VRRRGLLKSGTRRYPDQLPLIGEIDAAHLRAVLQARHPTDSHEPASPYTARMMSLRERRRERTACAIERAVAMLDHRDDDPTLRRPFAKIRRAEPGLRASR